MSESTTLDPGAGLASDVEPSAPDTGVTDAELREAEAAEAASPTPEPTAAEQAPPKFVPHAALHEARQQLKEEREARKRLEERQDRLQEFLTRRSEPQGQPQPVQPEIPSRDADPVGYFDAKTTQLERQLAAVAQPIAAQQQEAAFVGAYQRATQEFAASTPDFGPAYQHALQAMAQDAQFYGGASPIDAERMLVAAAFRQGKNPGQAIYEYAKARGYTGAAPQQQAQRAAPDMAAIQRGQQASRSVGAGGQPAGRGELTPQRLAEMSTAELAKVPDDVFKRVLGG